MLASASRSVLRRAGASTRSLSTVGELLDTASDKYPHKETLRVIDQKLRWSFSSLKKHSDALACGLLEMGVKPGSTVALALPNNAENVVAHYAAAKAGFVVAGEDEAASADVFIYDPKVNDGDSSSAVKISTGFWPPEGGYRYMDIPVYQPNISPLDYVNVTATTPLKKQGAAVLTHADVIKAGSDFVSSLKLTNEDRILAKSGNSAVSASVGAISSFSAVVIPGEDVASAKETENCTHEV